MEKVLQSTLCQQHLFIQQYQNAAKIYKLQLRM